MPNVEFVTGGMLEVGEALSGALFHIGNDAGITHVAGSFNVPTVGIYGPTGPGSWGSFAEYNELIWGKKGVCEVRCNYDVILNCEHKICLNSVTVNRVIEALFKVLQRAYSDRETVIIKNPQVEYTFKNGEYLVQVDGKDLLLECRSEEIQKDIKLLFETPHKLESLNEDMQKVIKVLKEQNVFYNVPTFRD